MRRPFYYFMLHCCLISFVGCLTQEELFEEYPEFQKDEHPLIPELDTETHQISAGAVTGRALEQPIPFPHYTHVQTLKMECEFCHSEARKSIHAGVPPTQTCMNCHQYVKTDSPKIAKVKEYYDKGESIPWKKVHDLPDHVHFSHKRHVKAGVQCTECHGQVGLMGKSEFVEEYAYQESTESHESEGAHKVKVEKEVVEVMTRESTLQMGWCLDCHGSHPSIDKNYGDVADLRRAELKDCWTCHK